MCGNRQKSIRNVTETFAGVFKGTKNPLMQSECLYLVLKLRIIQIRKK